MGRIPPCVAHAFEEEDMKKPMYGRLWDSRVFRTREEAEAWGEKQKEDLKSQGMSPKTDIEFVTATSEWRCKLYVKIS